MRDRATWILALVLGALVALEAAFVHPHHQVFPWHHLTGYMALIGLVSCIVVVLASKALGKVFLQRPDPEEEDRG